MNQRTTADIAIKRGNNTIVTVPITPDARRTYHLMQSDTIKLTFLLATPIHFAVGDYIDDELFGRFIIAREQMPTYDNNTGAYKYDLLFVAPYWMWQNELFMLITEVSGDDVRKETEWTLTANLATHVGEVCKNLAVFDTSDYYTSFALDITAEKADEVHCVTYSGQDIISALNAMANQWDCEWWVTAVGTAATIHFGKLEHGEPISFELGENVESMSIQDGTNVYANKIFAFGGETNVPSTYRKTLTFEVSDTASYNGVTLFRDDTKKVTPRMVLAASTTDSYQHLTSQGTSIVDEGTFSTNSFQVDEPSELHLYGSAQQGERTIVRVRPNTIGNVSLYNVTIIATLVNERSGETYTLATYRKMNNIPTGTWETDPNANIWLLIDYTASLVASTYHVEVAVAVTAEDNQSPVQMQATYEGDIIVPLERVTKSAAIVFDDTEYAVTYNPFGQYAGDDYYNYFCFDDGVPSGFGIGSEYTLKGIDYTEIPASWYATPYEDPSTLQSIGARRLRMPSSDYVTTTPPPSTGSTVEKVVIFNKIIPHAIEKITSVATEACQSLEEREDGSKVTWAWTKFTLKASLLNGDPFPFRTKYITDGSKLRIRFISPQDVPAGSLPIVSPCKLAGMAFDVQYNDFDETYTIVRNDEYGAMLPNDELCPTVGDPFILEGWNPLCMEELGLIAAAEAELQAKAEDYLSAIEEGVFNFTCNMMSDFGYLAMRLIDSEEHPFEDANESDFYVRNDGSVYALPSAGAKVTIYHAALKGGSKTSRIIGFDYKLDMPYDTPQYEVGETEAYSRLRKIEKEITQK